MKPNLIGPAWFNLFIPLSIAAHFTLPIQILIHSPLRYLGLSLMVAGMVLNLGASSRLREYRTSVEFKQKPTQLVTTGPFRLSRNPMYLGGLMVLAGITLFLGSLVTLFFPVLLFLLLNFLYIPSEEIELERIFGMEYIEYKQKVRRWV